MSYHSVLAKHLLRGTSVLEYTETYMICDHILHTENMTPSHIHTFTRNVCLFFLLHFSQLVDDAKLRDFVAEFGNTIWEDDHDAKHVTVAELMKRMAVEPDAAARKELERQVRDVAASQA